MENLYINPTKKSLEVDLKEGELSFTGCSITNDPKAFFTPVRNWVNEYSTSPEKTTTLNFKFEYIDSASVKIIYEILKDFKEIQKKGYEIIINWYFDYNDPEILELGEILKSKIKLEFSFIEYSEDM